METSNHALIFSEILRMRALHTSVWAGVSVFWIALSIMMALDKGSLFGPVFFLLLGLPIFILPAMKYVVGRVTVQIATDGMYVETTFPRRKRLKLFGWEQVNSCELKYYPEAGHVGFHKSGLFLLWTHGLYAASFLRYGMYGSLYWKPLFGEKEVHFQVSRNGGRNLIVMDTNRPADFVRAVEEAASAFLRKDFRVTIQEKPSAKERYYLPVMGLVFAIIIIGLTLVAVFFIPSFRE